MQYFACFKKLENLEGFDETYKGCKRIEKLMKILKKI